MVGILTGNHVLIDDVPGVGKTTLVRMLSTLLGSGSSGCSSHPT